MRTLFAATAVLAICVLAIHTTPVGATGTFRDDWLAAYPEVCNDLVVAANSCVLCHSGPGLNDYGIDLASGDPSDPVAIESTDSDNDGRDNGEEINLDCTLPGDAASDTDPTAWSEIKALYREVIRQSDP